MRMFKTKFNKTSVALPTLGPPIPKVGQAVVSYEHQCARRVAGSSYAMYATRRKTSRV